MTPTSVSALFFSFIDKPVVHRGHSAPSSTSSAPRRTTARFAPPPIVAIIHRGGDDAMGFRVRLMLDGEPIPPTDYGGVVIAAPAVDRIVNAIYEADAQPDDAGR